MSQVAAPISIALPKSNIARFDFFHTPGQALSPVDSQPRHLQPEQRYALCELNLLNTRSRPRARDRFSFGAAHCGHESIVA